MRMVIDRRATRALLVVVATALTSLAACGDDAGAGGGGGEGGDPFDPLAPPPTPSAELCDRVEPGAIVSGSVGELQRQWSALHAGMRFFGPIASHATVDGALAHALEEVPYLGLYGLSLYADALEGTCALQSGDGLAPARVELEGNIAVVHPGLGALSLPEGTEAVVVDLRSLPSAPELEAVIDAAVGLALATPVPRGNPKVRVHRGMTDEVVAPLFLGSQNVYDDAVEVVELDPIPAGSNRELPLVLLTSDRLAPEAARVAFALRILGRAWIAGEDLDARVAESRWWSLGGGGFVHRDRAFESWPDVLPADLRAVGPLEAAKVLLERGSPTAVELGPNTRGSIEPFDEELEIQPDEASPGVARAALFTAHGAARSFFPYFDVTGDTIDEALDAELTAILDDDALDARAIERSLRRFSHELYDSHGYVFYLGAQGPAQRVVPVLLDVAEAEVVVRTSALGTLQPGDVLLEVDGEPVDDRLLREGLAQSASNPGAALRNAMQALTLLEADAVWRVRRPGGAIEDVLIDFEALTNEPAPPISARTHGYLDDLGAPGVYYVNLDAGAYDGTPMASALMAEAEGATALVLDARGYPGSLETWQLVRRVLVEPTTVRFRTPIVSTFGSALGPVEEAVWAPVGLGGSTHYDGPVVVLIGTGTQSQAEYLLMPLQSTGRATFVGRRTAGANGNITGLMLPGAMALSFTGMQVTFADGSTFHGVGIAPTVEVGPTAAQLGQGLDPELEAALAVIASN